MTTKKEQRRIKIKFRIRKSVNGRYSRASPLERVPFEQADLRTGYQRSHWYDSCQRKFSWNGEDVWC